MKTSVVLQIKSYVSTIINHNLFLCDLCSPDVALQLSALSLTSLLSPSPTSNLFSHYFTFCFCPLPVETWLHVVVVIVDGILYFEPLYGSVAWIHVPCCESSSGVTEHHTPFSHLFCWRGGLTCFCCFHPAGKEDEIPKKPLGQLPPELTALAVVNHVANGQSHVEPAEPPRDHGPLLEQQRESRPPSRARKDSLDRPIRHHKADRREAHSRGSGENPNEQQRPTASTTAPERGVTPPSAPTPAPQPTPARKPHSHATANHNSNAASSSRKDITPRWVKPSETKLEAAKAAAAREGRACSPAPSCPDDNVPTTRRPRPKGFVPGSNRGSNASQYDNVPGLPEQDFDIVELERPPSRMRNPRSETPISTSSLHQGTPSHGPSLTASTDSVVSGLRMANHPHPPPFSHNSPAGIQTSYPTNQYHTPPQQHSPAKPVPHISYGEERLYSPPSRLPSPSSLAYRDRVYATAQRPSHSRSPERALFNNSYATYRKQPSSSAQNLLNARPPQEHLLQLETPGSSTPIYLRQPTWLNSATQVYAPVDYRFEGPNPQISPDGGSGQVVDGHAWAQEDELPPPCSPGGVPRSPSFQRAQMSPVQEFVFPANPDDLLHYRTQFQEKQPDVRQQPPQLFGGPHYRHAQEAFAMQESMLL